MYTLAFVPLRVSMDIPYRIAGNFRGVKIRYFCGQANLHEMLM